MALSLDQIRQQSSQPKALTLDQIRSKVSASTPATPPQSAAPAVGTPERFNSVITQDPLTQTGIGVVKGIGSTLKSLGTIGQTFANQTVGRVANLVTGKGFTPTTGPLFPTAASKTEGDIYSPNTPAAKAADEKLAPKGAAQNVGYYGEKIGEFLLPSGAVKAGQTAVDAAITAPGLLPAAGRVFAKAGIEAGAAGGVSFAQTADPKTAGWTALTAGLIKTGTGTIGEVLKGSRIPEWLYSKVFKTTYDDMEAELKTGGAAALQKSDPELYKTLVDRGIIKTAANGTVTLDETLAKQALDKGLKGGLHNMANVTVKNLYKNELAVQDIAANAPGVVKVSEPQFESVLRDIGARYQDVGFGDFAKRAMDLANKIKEGAGELSVADALNARRLLDGLRASSSFGETPPTLSLGQKNLKFLADALRSRLAKVPGMAEVMKDYSFNIDALEALSKEAARRGNNQVISLIDSVLLGGGVASSNPVTGGLLYAARKGLNQPAIVTRAAQAIDKSGTLTKIGAAAKGTLFEALKALQQ